MQGRRELRARACSEHEHRDRRPGPDLLLALDHARSRRRAAIDTRFFICELPAGPGGDSHCGVETVDGVWITPSRAIARFEAGEISLVSVTVEHLKRLAQFSAPAAAAGRIARTKPIRTVNPKRRGERLAQRARRLVTPVLGDAEAGEDAIGR